jgi:hypothetical protein
MRHEIKFKTWSCGRVWASRGAFVGDADIQPIGVTFAKDPPAIFYFFNHMTCESTLAVDVEEFRDLIEEPIPPADLSGTPECPKRCTTMEDLQSCDLDCHNAPYRRFLIERIVKRKI